MPHDFCHGGETSFLERHIRYSRGLVSALPLSPFVPKVCDKAEEAHWSENKNRIGKEVRREGQEDVRPPGTFLGIPEQKLLLFQ